MFKNLLRVLTDKSCWLRVRKFNRDWDRQVNVMLDSPVFQTTKHDPKGDFTVVLNGYCIWVENRFYAYGHLYNNGKNNDASCIPSRRTVFRLYDAVENFKGTL